MIKLAKERKNRKAKDRTFVLNYRRFGNIGKDFESVRKKIQNFAYENKNKWGWSFEFLDSFYDYLNKEICEIFHIEDFSDLIYKLMTKAQKHESFIDCDDIIHIQSSIDGYNLKNLHKIVKIGLWDDDFGEYPDVVWIEGIGKYLVYNGNHRTTLFCALNRPIRCTVHESDFLQDFLNMACKDY